MVGQSGSAIWCYPTEDYGSLFITGILAGNHNGPFQYFNGGPRSANFRTGALGHIE